MEFKEFAYCSDKYQYTMGKSFMECGKGEKIAIFNLFYRQAPENNNWAVVSGTDEVIEMVENLGSMPEEFFEKFLPGDAYAEFRHYLAGMKFTGNVYAMREGEIAFPNQPIITVEAPLIQAQVLETPMLCIMNHQMAVATKASRVVYAAKGDGIMEFGLRRAQGPDAGIYGARAAMIGGCIGTSNVLTGQMFDVPVKGTHAHSFPDEYTAFKTYSKLYPDACILLVDTYDVLNSGVPNAIRVFQEMKEEGIPLKGYGIRIDSGDLAYLSKQAYKMLADAGFEDAIISASSDLDEYLIDSLKAQGAKINSWGVGTNLITSNGHPAFGGVYKLAAIKAKEDQDFVPKIKLSENVEKVTNPGNKTIYRIYDKETGKIRADLICLADEVFDPEEDMIIFDPMATWKKTKITGGTYTLRELLIPVFLKGECVYTSPSVMEIREICKKEKETLWDETLRLVNPQEVYVDLSDKLFKIKSDLLEEMGKAAIE